MKIELVPDLEHCIETVARKKHAELTHILLKSKEGDTETEEKLETLRSFLETADFKRLRSESEIHLAKGKKVRCIIYLDDDIPKCEMHVT
jgi:hypothetical protein